MSRLIICCCWVCICCVCAYVFACLLEHLFLWGNTKGHPSHYFIPSNHDALLWHVSVCEISQRNIWFHNKKALIAIDYQSSQQRRGFVSCHFQLGYISSSGQCEKSFVWAASMDYSQYQWRSQTQKPRVPPGLRLSLDPLLTGHDDCGSLGHRWHRRQNPSCRDPHHCFHTCGLGRL